MPDTTTVTETPTDESPYVTVPTRPTAASRHARRAKAPRKVTRYTLDLEAPAHMFLRTYALMNGVEASKVMRTLLWLLEADSSVSDRVLDELFADDQPESAFTPDEEPGSEG